MKLQQLLVVQAEHKLETVLLGVRVPVGPIPIAGIVGLILNFSGRDAKRDRLVRFSSHLPTNVSINRVYIQVVLTMRY